mgnify:CR=1 FL=1
MTRFLSFREAVRTCDSRAAGFFSVLPGSCAACDSLLLFSSPQGQRQPMSIKIKSTMALCSSALLHVAFRASSLWSINSSWIPTASAVRCYTVMQSLLWLLCFPLSCQATWSACCWVCVDTQHLLNLRDLLFLLIDCAIRMLAPTASLCRWAIRLPSYSVSCMWWSSGAINRRLQCSCCCLFRLLLLLFTVIDCEPLLGVD